MTIRRFNQEGVPWSQVREELAEAAARDRKFRDQQVLYSMCNEPSENAKEAHGMFLEANLGDPGLYKGTQSLHDSVINILLSIMQGDTAEMGGMVVSGGSEANITALWIYRNLTKRRIILAPETAHYSVTTAADLLGMELKYVPVDEHYRMDPEALRSMLQSESVAVVVAMAGTTEHGQIDPIPRIQRICHDLNVFLHIDAAFGGLVFPFLQDIGYPDTPQFGFALEGVTSITIDPHKMGMATAPAGALLLRNPKNFNAVSQETIYLSTPSLHSILGTRCSAGAASAYAMLRCHGRSGYMRLLQKCMRNTTTLVRLLREANLELAVDPISPVVCVKLADELQAIRTQKELANRQWLVSRTTHPHGIRVVLMPHIEEETLAPFVFELKSIVG